MFTKINKEWKTTVIIVTHNQELTKLATTVIQVKDGNATKVKG
jgi:putative ABC transport system ATP-binding protein